MEPAPPAAEVEAVEPPEDDEPGFHFAETDPSQRFGRFDQVLGRGAFKVVYKAFDTQEGTEVAWNQVRVSELMSAKDAENKEERDRLFAEIRVLKALKHKNIMSFYDSWYDPRTYTVSFITELFTSGTLRQYRKRHKHIDGEVLKRWAWQILCGLVYLHGHSPPIIHRDLKCDNIFINGSDGVVKIGDLGLATMLRSRTAPQSVLGTPEFMAPELYEEEYDDRVDVYSFGMCLLELATMEYPYSECKNAAQIYRKVSLGVRPAGLQKVASPELAEFINVCIGAREARPRARQLLKHPYFDSIRKDKLLASRSDAALAAHGDGASEYGLLASGAVSRTASSLNDMLAAAAASAGHPGPGAGAGAPLQGPPSAASVGGAPPPAPPPALSRTGSSDAHSERAHSDAASVRSQRSNASELAAAVLENIAEEGEATDAGESGAASPERSRQASKHVSPRGSPPPPGSPPKPGSPGGSGSDSDGCRCESTERSFLVKGDWLQGAERIQLRLRICEPTGASRMVEFEFDVAVDTAADVASEMVADLELTPEDAVVIAALIRAELERLSALPQITPQTSISLAKAAQVLEHSLTTNALEQAHSSGGGRDSGSLGSREGSLAPRNGLAPAPGGPAPLGAYASREPSLLAQTSSRQMGRFSEQTSAPPALPASDALLVAALAAAQAAPAQPPAAAPASAPPSQRASIEAPSSAQPSQRGSLDSQPAAPAQPQMPPAPPLRPSGGSASSLVSVSSASSLPYSVASAASQAEPAAPPAPGLALPTGLARRSPPPRPGMPPRPVSPLAAGAPAAPDFPSPSQRVLRSNSVDAMALLARSSSLPPGREAVASPLGTASGGLSPSGILSPAASVHDKRVPLGRLFENLGYGEQREAEGGGRLEGGSAPLTPGGSLPPLPSPGGRLPPGGGSGASLDGAAGSADLAMLRPRSEACLASLAPGLARLSGGVLPAPPAPGSAPSAAGGLAASLSLSDLAGAVASPLSASSCASPRCAGGQPAAVAAAAADTIQRLDLQSSAPLALAPPPPPPPALARVGAHALSAPPSKLPSRDSSPTRERDCSLSPTRAPADGALNGRRPALLRDKEALRRQAVDAMKAVELRSLNLLEGGLGGKACATRGVPMAVARSTTNLVTAGAPPPPPPAPGPPPAANGVHPAPPRQQQQQPASAHVGVPATAPLVTAPSSAG